jgi:hypothetical protein
MSVLVATQTFFSGPNSAASVRSAFVVKVGAKRCLLGSCTAEPARLCWVRPTDLGGTCDLC